MASNGYDFQPSQVDGVFISILVLFVIVLILAAVFKKSSTSGFNSFVRERDKAERINQALEIMLGDIQGVMSGAAKGDLSRKIAVDASGNMAILKDSVHDVPEMLSQTMAHVTSVTEEINGGSSQMSSASQSLSSGTTEQAASLEEISSSMSEVGSRANTNNDNAKSGIATDHASHGDCQSRQ